MRAKLRGESSQFADFLLSIGDGRRTPQRQRAFFIKLPDDTIVENEKELLDFVLGGGGVLKTITQTRLGYHHAQSFVLPTVK